MRQAFKNIKSRYASPGTFGANVLTLMSGTAVAQAIPILVSPILTRIYTPEDFGAFALYMSVATILSVLATGRYELAIMLPEKDSDAANIAMLSILIALCVGAASALILYFWDAHKLHDLGRWRFWIPLSVLFMAFFNVLNYWANRKKYYKNLAIAKACEAGAASGANVSFGFWGIEFGGLILGSIVGKCFSLFILARQTWQKDSHLKKQIGWQDMKRQARIYRDFPRITLFHGLMDMLQSNGVILLLTAFFGKTNVGFYSFSMRILFVPATLIGAAVAQVFYQKASETYHQKGDLKALVKKNMIRLTVMALPIFLMIMVFAPAVFALIFGENWREAGVYARMLSPWIMLRFIYSPVSQIPLLLSRQKSYFYIGAVYNGIIFSAVALCGYLDAGPQVSISIMSFAGMLYLFFVIWWLFSIIKKDAYAV